MKKHVGIEALAIAVPRRYVDIEDLARARGVDPAKYTAGLGAQGRWRWRTRARTRWRWRPRAAARLLAAATRWTRRRIGMLVVGTETGVDHSKPVASHVQGLLRLPRAMRTYDTQHACYGGTAGLMAAAEWIASGAAAGRSRLVVCTDIARYGAEHRGRAHPGRRRGGAAGVGDAGRCWRWTWGSTARAASTCTTSGGRSAAARRWWTGTTPSSCYLDALSGAYRGWRERALAHGGWCARRSTLPSEQLARILYHVPFCKMARKAHAQLRLCDLEDARHAGRHGPGARGAGEVAGSYEAQVATSLGLNARMGNVYTASLYLALAGLLSAEGAALAASAWACSPTAAAAARSSSPASWARRRRSAWRRRTWTRCWRRASASRWRSTSAS